MIEQNNKKTKTNLFFNVEKFLSKYKHTKKFKLIITKKRSGIKGPVIKPTGIKKIKISENIINLSCIREFIL